MAATRQVRCQVPLNQLSQFRADLEKHRYPFREERALNGSRFEVEIPVRMANVFATWVNSNFGDML